MKLWSVRLDLRGFFTKNEHPSAALNFIRSITPDRARKAALNFPTQWLRNEGKRKKRLRLIGWTAAAMSGALAERVADSGQASRAVLRVEQGWCKKKCEERTRFAAMCEVERRVLVIFITNQNPEWNGTTQGLARFFAFPQKTWSARSP